MNSTKENIIKTQKKTPTLLLSDLNNLIKKTDKLKRTKEGKPHLREKREKKRDIVN